VSKYAIRKYYMDQPADGLWTRLSHRLTRRPIPDFPRTLQIQTVTGCNADCVFCPYGETHDTQPKGAMSHDLFRRIVDEAAQHHVHRITPNLMNEPLMDHGLLDKVRYINERLPGARVVITTNGHFLTPAVTAGMLELGGGIHELYVSVQGIDKESYETTMRGSMRLERTLANVEHFLSEQGRRGIDRPRLWVTMVDTNLIDARKAVAYWQGRGVDSKFTMLENRGGNIPEAESYSRTGAMSTYDNCPRPFKQAYIMFNGDMVLCCVDYSRKQVLGNITRSSIQEIWNGPIATEIRRRYIAREMDRLPLCGRCTIDRVREVSVSARGRRHMGAPAD
jgi:MoaA/NifB/PqqE/SkfB family radical SAM enzyme